jgi:putative DNA primase/helicase
MIPYNTLSTNPMLEEAQGYARLGWRVFPVWWAEPGGQCACPRPNCNHVGKHPIFKGWTTQATTDPNQIKFWWTRFPEANIGIATGKESGIFVFDVDVKHNGPENLEIHERQHGTLPASVRSATGGGGMHILLTYPKDKSVQNATGIIPGCDIRSDGGFIVAPPSRHASGNTYEWLPGQSPTEVKPADSPQWILQLMPTSNLHKFARSGPDTVIKDGSRNSTLASLAGTMRARGMSDEAIEAALLEENKKHCRPPLEEDEVRGIAQSISRYPSGGTSPKFKLTELGNAERLAYYHGQDLRYCPHWNKWLVWDGKRWAIDYTREVNRRVCETNRSMLTEASALNDDTARRELVKWQRISESSKSTRETIEHAKSLHGISILPDKFDRPQWILNVENGTIDLKTGKLMPHRREDLITKLAQVTLDPYAKCPTWDGFLHKIMSGNKNIIDFLQRVIGYSLTGSTREQCLFILHGNGANGKSTFLKTISDMLGNDYVTNTPTQTLMVRRGESIPNDIAALKGARLVTAVEAEEGQKLAESLVKSMTGGDKMTARFMRGEFFSFEPEFKIFLATNHKPQISGTDKAIWRRIYLIPFEVTIPDKEKDPDFPDKLREELPGILNWAIEGCLQ